MRPCLIHTVPGPMLPLHLVHLYRLAGAASRGVVVRRQGRTSYVPLQPIGCMVGQRRVSVTSPFPTRPLPHEPRVQPRSSLHIDTYAPYALRGTTTAFPPVGGRNVEWAQPLSRPPICLRVDDPGPARLRNAREPSVTMDSWELTDQSACIIPAIAFLPPFPLRQRPRNMPPSRDLDGQRALLGQAAPPLSDRESHARTPTHPNPNPHTHTHTHTHTHQYGGALLVPVLTQRWGPGREGFGSGPVRKQYGTQKSRRTEQVANTNCCHRRVGVLDSNSASCVCLCRRCLPDPNPRAPL